MKKIKDLRSERGLTQRELAKKLNVSQCTISNWEVNQSEIAAKYLVRIAKFFEISVDELVGLFDED